MAADSEFVFDAVVGFLTSPIWNTPVLTFIEQKCIVFDPDGESHESYKEIHEEYKTLVETLLSSFLKDVGITAEQFTTACKDRGGSSQFNDVHKNIFEQIWAAEDIEVFKRLMIQKNIEIQLQALRLIQQHGNAAPVSQQAVITPPVQASPPPVAPALTDEDSIMQEVLRLSKEEYDAQTKEKSVDQELETAVAESKQENDSQSLTHALEEAENAFERRLLTIAKREQEEMEKALKVSIRAQKEAAEEAKKLKADVQKDSAKFSKSEEKQPQSAKAAPISTLASALSTKTAALTSKVASSKAPAAPHTKKNLSVIAAPSVKAAPPAAKTPAEAAESWMSSAKAEASSISSSDSGQDQQTTEELRRRTEYLKQQRDKLVALKKQERERRLEKYTEEQPKARPNTARTARLVTAGKRLDSASPEGPDNGKKLAMRRALADVLKREVIDKQ